MQALALGPSSGPRCAVGFFEPAATPLTALTCTMRITSPRTPWHPLEGAQPMASKPMPTTRTEHTFFSRFLLHSTASAIRMRARSATTAAAVSHTCEHFRRGIRTCIVMACIVMARVVMALYSQGMKTCVRTMACGMVIRRGKRESRARRPRLETCAQSAGWTRSHDYIGYTYIGHDYMARNNMGPWLYRAKTT